MEVSLSNLIHVKVTNGLNHFIKIFRENPFDFLSESDIQAAIYSILHEQIKEPFYMKVETLKNRKLIDKDQILTNLVKTQYPSISKKLKTPVGLFDIAIIHPDSKIPASQTNEGWWTQKLLGAIEIKYFQETNKKENVSGLRKDLLKLKDYGKGKDDFKFGLALLFIQAGVIEREFIEKENMRIMEETNDIRDIFGIGGYIISKEVAKKVIISEW